MGFTAEKTKHGFWSIESDGVRAFLFEGEKKALLVDTTRSTGLGAFCKTLTAKPIFVVTTHADIDHIASDSEFSERYMHPSEFAHCAVKGSFLPDTRPIWEGDIIDIGTYKFEIVLIPGHTPGSIMLVEREKRFALGGDSIQTGPIFMFGPGRNFHAFIASMTKILPIVKDLDTIYSSHHELMIPPSMVSELIDGAKGYLAGKAEYFESPDRLDKEVKECVIGKCHFYALKA